MAHRLRAAMVALLFVVVAGCCGKALRQELTMAEAVSAAFVKKLDAGETNREQEQAFIRKTHETITKARKAAEN